MLPPLLLLFLPLDESPELLGRSTGWLLDLQRLRLRRPLFLLEEELEEAEPVERSPVEGLRWRPVIVSFILFWIEILMILI